MLPDDIRRKTELLVMMIKKRIPLIFMFFAVTLMTHAQHIAISNNVVFDMMGALSAGVEIPTSKASSWEVYGSIRPWKRGNITVHKHWLLQAQYRIWPCQVMNGVFFGPYIHGGEYNIGDKAVLFSLLKGFRQHRYEGMLIGGGIGAGYEHALAKHWNIGAEIGVGYTYINYLKSACETCGTYYGYDDYHYLGISRLGLSVIYVF